MKHSDKRSRGINGRMGSGYNIIETRTIGGMRNTIEHIRCISSNIAIMQ